MAWNYDAACKEKSVFSQPPSRVITLRHSTNWLRNGATRDYIIKVKINHKTPVIAEIMAKRVYEKVAKSCKPRVDPTRWLIVERLSDGTYQYLPRREQLLAGYRDIAKRIDTQLPRIFGKMPRLTYRVLPVPTDSEKSQVSGHYHADRYAPRRRCL